MFEPFIIDDVIFFDTNLFNLMILIPSFSEYIVQHGLNIVFFYSFNVVDVYLIINYLMHQKMCLNFLKCVGILYNQIVFPRDEPSKIILTKLDF